MTSEHDPQKQSNTRQRPSVRTRTNTAGAQRADNRAQTASAQQPAASRQRAASAQHAQPADRTSGAQNRPTAQRQQPNRVRVSQGDGYPTTPRAHVQAQQERQARQQRPQEQASSQRVRVPQSQPHANTASARARATAQQQQAGQQRQQQPRTTDRAAAAQTANRTPRPAGSGQAQRRPQQQQPSARQQRPQQAAQAQRVQYSRQQWDQQQRRSKQRPAGQHSYGQMTPADPHRYTKAVRAANRRQQNHTPRIIGAIVAVVALIAAVILFIFPPIYTVTINGESHTVNAGTTMQDVINNGYASPHAGNFLAVDGSIIAAGRGEPFLATWADGSTTDPKAKVPRNAEVTIADGGDITETFTESTEEIPFESRDVPASSSSYYAGAIHIFSDGENGEKVTKTGDTSGKTISEITKQPIDSGYHSYTPDTNGEKIVALTFDDGPWNTTTQQILDILNENGAVGTFFMIGNQVEEHASVVRALVDSGNQIASHTWDHASGSGRGVNLTYMSSDEQIKEIEKSFEVLDSVAGTTVSRVLRAPGGNYYGSVITTLHPYIDAEIGWEVDTEDWRRPGPDAIIGAAKTVEPGQTILMHDGGGDRSQTVEALRTIVPWLKSEGYRFVTIDELLSYPMPPSI